MRIFGLTITRERREKALSQVSDRGWFPLISEPFSGAWQRNIEVRVDTALTYSAVYACVSLIAADIGKLRLKLVAQDSNGIWSETESAAYSPVLRKPNRYQTRIDFFTNWVTSKLIHGNTYVLKVRDNRNVVSALYILDPCLTRVLVADDGSVFYQLQRDNLTGQTEETVVVPASEIIHDRVAPLWHPLCGVSPITACGLSALHGLNIQKNSVAFFGNFARPSGIITAPATIKDEDAKRFQERWEENYGAGKMGKTAVLGGGITYVPLTMTAVDAQLIEQLKMTAETVCSCFHVPPYMIGVGSPPTYNNIEALNQQYYSQCLQTLIESIEELLDYGLDLKKSVDGLKYGTEFDLDDLLRMDTATRMDVSQKAIKAGMSPNEVRKKFHGLGPKIGGDEPYLQQQDFSLSALHERDQNKPFATPSSPPAAAPAPAPQPDAEVEDADEDAPSRQERRQSNIISIADRLDRRSNALARAS
jgi:HK97 family phage portal protein